MTHIDLVAIVSTFLLLLAIGGALADRAWSERADPRRMARRVK